MFNNSIKPRKTSYNIIQIWKFSNSKSTVQNIAGYNIFPIRPPPSISPEYKILKQNLNAEPNYFTLIFFS